jgi:hypothetical protein
VRRERCEKNRRKEKKEKIVEDMKEINFLVRPSLGIVIISQLGDRSLLL